jgi:hypothetical protein
VQDVGAGELDGVRHGASMAAAGTSAAFRGWAVLGSNQRPWD